MEERREETSGGKNINREVEREVERWTERVRWKGEEWRWEAAFSSLTYELLLRVGR